MSLKFDFLHYVTKTKHSKTMAFQRLVQSLPSLQKRPIIQTQWEHFNTRGTRHSMSEIWYS